MVKVVVCKMLAQVIAVLKAKTSKFLYLLNCCLHKID